MNMRLRFCLTLLTVALFAANTHSLYSAPVRERHYSDFSVYGIDVSRYQEIINWKKLSKEKMYNGEKNVAISFVFIKATEGETKVDSYFKKNWKNAENKIPRGAYHYYIPSRDAKRQAKNFISNVRLKQGDFPPVLDVEKIDRYIERHNIAKKDFIKGVINWLSIIEEKYKVKPIIYCTISDHENYFNTDEFKDYPFWIAHYSHSTLRIKEKWSFWQYTQTGKIKGVTGNIDFNVFSGTLDDLQKLRIQN